MPTRKKKTPSQPAKRGRVAEKPKDYPVPDPEWDALEERYSQIGAEMHSLAKMLNISNGGGEEQ